eukprot:10700836-Karenia_brevis.AAC.1
MEDDVYQQYFRVKENVDISDVATFEDWNTFFGEDGLLGAPILVRSKRNKIENVFVDALIESLVNLDNVFSE